MRTFFLRMLLPLLALPPGLLSAAGPVILPVAEPAPGASHRVVWPADPGIRYELQESEDLETWRTVAGFPTEAAALAQQHTFEATTDKGFFRVRRLDEQPPRIVDRRPRENEFAVGRFSAVAVQLADATGVDVDSLVLTVGELGSFTLADEELSYVDDILRFDQGGNTALGGYGETITATLDVADVHGSATTQTWSFDLELEPQVASNLFVFGSPVAAQAGQELDVGPARVLSEHFANGTVRMSVSTDSWKLDRVEEDRVIIAYTGESGPAFSVGALICNLTPRIPEEIFYRVISGVTDDSETGLLTLLTADAALEDFIETGSLSLTEGAVVFEEDEFGEFTAASSLGTNLTFEPLGFDYNGIQIIETEALALGFGKLTWTFSPSLEAAIEFGGFRLRRMHTEATGRFRAEIRPEVTIAQAVSGQSTVRLANIKRSFYLGAIGPVPVWGGIDLSLDAALAYNMTVSGTLSSGVAQNMDLALGVRYDRSMTPALRWIRSSTLQSPQLLPVTATLAGSASGSVRLVPQLNITYLRLARLFANIDPGFEISGEGSIGTGGTEPAAWTMKADAHLRLGAEIVAFDLGSGVDLQVKLFDHLWTETQPPPGEITFTRQPQGFTAMEGDTVVLSATAVAAEPVTYQWFQEDLPLPGETGEDVILEDVGSGHAGAYQVEATAGGQKALSAPAEVEVELADDSHPPVIWTELVPVPGLSYAWEIGRYEVTWGEWKAVAAWAAGNGYDIGNVGDGCADNHPVHSVNWYDIAKWCNAKSEMEGLDPHYVHEGEVFRSGEDFPISLYNFQNFTGYGYHLPSSSEWLFAARASDTEWFTYSGSNDADEVAWHYVNALGAPCYTMEVWGGPGPGTWPVGLKLPNGLGLYDMSGNVHEWTHSWQNMPPKFITRGGHFWGGGATNLFGTVSFEPTRRLDYLGFRLARRTEQ